MSITAAQLVAEVAINGADSGISNLTQIGVAADETQIQLDATGKAADSFAEMFQMAAENMAAALDLPIESVVALQTEAESAFAGMDESATAAASGFTELGSAGETSGSSLIEILLELSQNVKDVGFAVDGMSSAVTGGLDDLYSGFASVGDAAATAGEEVAMAGESASESSGGFMDLFGKIGMGIFAFQGLIGMAGQAASALFGPAISAEEVTSSLEVFTGSAAKAKQELADLANFASHTPFETSAIDDAALKMQSVGINAKDVIPYITSLGDALDATGRISSADLGMIVNDFDKIKTEGHLTTDVMNSFALQGIDAWSVLEKQTGKTHEQLADLISKGLYPADQAMKDLTAGIEKSPLYKGQMANDTANFTGALSTLKSNFEGVLAQFGSPILKAVEPIINNLSTAFSSQGFKDFAGGVGKGIATAFKDISDGISGAAKWLGAFDLGGIAYQMKNLGDAIHGILSPLQQLGSNKDASAFFATLRDALAQGIVAAVRDVSQFIKSLADNLRNLGSNKEVTGFLSSLASGFKQVQTIVGGELGKDFQAFGKTVQDVGKWFQTSMLPAIQQAMPGFEHLGSVMATTVAPALAKIWAVGQQVARDALPPLTKAFETIAPIAVKVGGFLADNLGKALQFIAPFAVQAAQEIGKFATEIITRVVPFVQNLYNGIKAFLDWIKPYWPAIWDAIQTSFTTVWDVIKGAIQIAWAIVSGVIKVGLDLLSGNWKKVWDDIKSMFSGIWDGIKSIASGIWAAVQKPIMAGVDGFKKWWGTTWDDIKKKFSDIWNSLSGVASGAWNNISGAVRGGINAVIDAIDSFINGVNNIHVSLPGGINIGFNIPTIPHLATGGTLATGGVVELGEHGSEQVWLPGGATVLPHGQSFGNGGNQQPINIYVGLEGAPVAYKLMPHIVQNIRNATGARF